MKANKKIFWTDDILEKVIKLRQNGQTFVEIGQLLGKTAGQVRGALYTYRVKNGYAPAERTVPRGEEKCDNPEEFAKDLGLSTELADSFTQMLERKQLLKLPPTTIRDQISEANQECVNVAYMQEQLKVLAEENARLQGRLQQIMSIDEDIATGGTVTLRASDHHFGDANHLLNCGKDLERQFLEKLEKYKPKRIQIVAGDDFIAGRGIYRNQELDSALSGAEKQVKYGAMRAYEFVKAIREITDVPICWYLLSGNHDRSFAMSLSGLLRLTISNLCSDIEEFTITVERDSAIINLAHEGVYNVLVRHGTGYSKYGPNSNGFISDTKDELLAKSLVTPVEERCRRVLSGHTHWLSLGIEHIVGIKWDTTGGLQRNTRVKLGCNQRPVGWAVYIGVNGIANEVLEPLALTPSTPIYRMEIASPDLESYNLQDIGATLQRYTQRLQDLGVATGISQQGYYNNGR